MVLGGEKLMVIGEIVNRYWKIENGLEVQGFKGSNGCGVQGFKCRRRLWVQYTE